MWSAIKDVSTWTAAVAFIAAVLGSVLFLLIRQKAALIETAPSEERAKLVEMTLDGYRIEHDNLTRAQKYELLMTQIQLRRDRWRTVAMLLGLVAVLAVIVACYALSRL